MKQIISVAGSLLIVISNNTIQVASTSLYTEYPTVLPVGLSSSVTRTGEGQSGLTASPITTIPVMIPSRTTTPTTSSQSFTTCRATQQDNISVTGVDLGGASGPPPYFQKRLDQIERIFVCSRSRCLIKVVLHVQIKGVPPPPRDPPRVFQIVCGANSARKICSTTPTFD